ncbi:hypothetical protein [Faecalispora jeddahensis]|uniref:hypothetical protein n=1 Tax=Faecalispora jeddahensis TaxID=1414721 RepID=UPI00145B8009|nr:hypothetical protein [Faecalispora jeddahensis]
MSETTSEKKDILVNNFWKFNLNSQIMAFNETGKRKIDNNIAALYKKFTFKLERFKDPNTYEESLKITSYKQKDKDENADKDADEDAKEENGFIVTNLLTLENDIKQFKRFGVMLENTYYRDLSKAIELVYLNIKLSDIDAGQKERMEQLIDAVKDYVKGNSALISQDYCDIPVMDFNEIAMDCGYAGYEMRSLREALNTKDYIYVVSGRYAVIARINNKPIRVIRFHREKINVPLPEEKENVKKGKGATNEN